MFLFNDKKSYQRIEDLKERIETLEFKLKQREAEIQKLTQEQADAVKADVKDSTFVIDWVNMDVFSVERMGDHKEAYTVLGHWVNGEIAEWKFYCSHEQHEKLAKEFRDGFAKKDNPSMRKRSNSRPKV